MAADGVADGAESPPGGGKFRFTAVFLALDRQVQFLAQPVKLAQTIGDPPVFPLKAQAQAKVGQLDEGEIPGGLLDQMADISKNFSPPQASP